MKKIPTVYIRDWDGNPKYVTREPNPECAWVFAGEGTATRKYDGTCVMFDGTGWWARREIKPGKATPDGFVALATDEETGKTVGWEPIGQAPFAKWHADALATAQRRETAWPTGTYELVGPRINGNPENEDQHTLIAHQAAEAVYIHLGDWESIRVQILALRKLYGCEGIVWHHPDGRMAKLKARDFPEVLDA